MEGFFDEKMLLTYSGATLATALVTQFLKGVRWLDRLPTRALSYAIALIIMLTARLAAGGFDWRSAALTLINAVVVALAANGTHDAMNRG